MPVEHRRGLGAPEKEVVAGQTDGDGDGVADGWPGETLR
jgi:hypothetical protein